MPHRPSRAEPDDAPTTEVRTRQLLDHDALDQRVDVLRPDGTVWTAYARRLELPLEAGRRRALLAEAATVLHLAATAVASCERARDARWANRERAAGLTATDGSPFRER